MLDIKLIREKPEVIRNDLQKRGEPEKLVMLNDLIKYDKQWRIALTEVNNLRHQRKLVTAEIAKLKKTGQIFIVQHGTFALMCQGVTIFL